MVGSRSTMLSKTSNEGLEEIREYLPGIYVDSGINYLSLGMGDLARQQFLGSRSGASSWPQAQFEPNV